MPVMLSSMIPQPPNAIAPARRNAPPPKIIQVGLPYKRWETTNKLSNRSILLASNYLVCGHSWTLLQEPKVAKRSHAKKRRLEHDDFSDFDEPCDDSDEFDKHDARMFPGFVFTTRSWLALINNCRTLFPICSKCRQAEAKTENEA